MAKQKEIDVDEDLDLEMEDEKEEITFCAKSLKPGLWALGVFAGIIVIWAFFVKQLPSTSQITESWGEPEKTFSIFSQMAQPAGMHAAMPYHYICPNCPWNGYQLAVGPYGGYVCPGCGWKPQNFGAYGQTGLGAAGVTSASTKPVLIKQLGMEVVDTNKGVFVARVYENSWAEQGGLLHGDLIQKFNHKKVGRLTTFQNLVTTAPSEKRVPVRVVRNGKKVKLNVMVGEGEMEGVTIPQGQAVALWGPGGGRIPRGYGLGPGGYIVCPQCGYKTLRQQGVPVYSQRCPKDGGVMVREEMMQQVGQVQPGQGNPWGQ